MVPLDDPTDQRLTTYNALTDAQRRAAIDAEHGVFVVEGQLALQRLAASPYPVRSGLCHPGKLDVTMAALAGHDVPVYVAGRDVLAAVTGFDVHRGVLALAGRLPPTMPADLVAGARTIVVLEGLNDQENLGAIARSARALGIDGLLLDPTCGDPLYRRCVRVSMGEVLHLPFARIDDWPSGLWPVLEAAGFECIALTPAGDAESISTVQRAAGDRVAIVLGAEGPGLSSALLAGAVRRVRIPITSDVDSINVGHAAAIAFDRLRSPSIAFGGAEARASALNTRHAAPR